MRNAGLQSIAVHAALRGEGKAGKRTVVRGIPMRSRLEADFARHLDSHWIKWTYEPRPYFAKGKGYLPDFQVELGDRPAFIEVKPSVFGAELAKDKMEIIWETEPTAFLVIVSGQECRWFAANHGAPWVTWIERWAHL